MSEEAERRKAAPLGAQAFSGELRESFRVKRSVRGMVNYPVIADFLPERTHVAAYPPNKGVEEEKRLRNPLENVDRVIAPVDVGELVKKEGTELLRRHLPHKRFRQENGRAENPDADGGADALSNAKSGSCSDAGGLLRRLEQL